MLWLFTSDVIVEVCQLLRHWESDQEVMWLSEDSVMLLHFCVTLAKIKKGFASSTANTVIHIILKKIINTKKTPE